MTVPPVKSLQLAVNVVPSCFVNVMVFVDVPVTDNAVGLLLYAVLKVFQSVLDKAPDSKEVAVCMPIDIAELPLKEPPVNGDAIVKAFGVLAVIVILAEPLKATPLIFLKVCKVVAVVELPLNSPVIVPALKLPLASLLTIALAVFKFVAVVAELFTLPTAVIVFNLPLAIQAY